MDLTPENVRALQRSFSGIFSTAMMAAVPQWSRIATEIPSTTGANLYGWMAQIPRMREWLGERIFVNADAHESELRNKDYELSVRIPRNTIEDDTYGMYKPVTEQCGRSAMLLPDDLIAQVLGDGENILCYDEQGFFDTSHPVIPGSTSGSTFQNYWSTGMALTADNFKTVYNTMTGYRGEDGRKLRVRPNLLVVPPSMEITANTIVKATLVNGGDTNILAGMVEVVVLEELEDEKAWYLLDTRSPIKPLIWQPRKAPKLILSISPDDDSVRYRKRFDFLVDGRGAAGFSLPFLAAKARAA